MIETTALPPALRKALRGPLKQAQKHIDEIAKRRDALRTILEDIEAIYDSTEEGVDDLQRGIDKLSEYL